MRFQVGDMVRCAANSPYGRRELVKGSVGVIRLACEPGFRFVHDFTDDNIYNYAVEFEDCIDGHSCCGSCEGSHGLWMKEDELLPFDDDTPLCFDADAFTCLMNEWTDGMKA